MGENVVITGRPLEDLLFRLVDCGGETVLDSFDYPEVRYAKFAFWFTVVPPGLVADRHIIPFH